MGLDAQHAPPVGHMVAGQRCALGSARRWAALGARQHWAALDLAALHHQVGASWAGPGALFSGF